MSNGINRDEVVAYLYPDREDGDHRLGQAARRIAHELEADRLHWATPRVVEVDLEELRSARSPDERADILRRNARRSRPV
jgi:hypothetical protein